MSSIKNRIVKPMPRSLPKYAVTLAIAALLGACQSIGGSSSDASYSMRSPFTEKFPIQVVNEKESITLVVKPHVFSLSRDDKNRVAVLAESYKHVGHGNIWVVAPTGSTNSAASIGAAAEIAKVMVDQGIDPTAIRMNSYEATSSNEEAPITVLFKRYHAYAESCGDWGDNLAFTPFNASSQNLGCSSHSNLAALIEDPYDLHKPRRIDPADAARRATVFENYRTGTATQSERSADESGAVSDVNED